MPEAPVLSDLDEEHFTMPARRVGKILLILAVFVATAGTLLLFVVASCTSRLNLGSSTATRYRSAVLEVRHEAENAAAPSLAIRVAKSATESGTADELGTLEPGESATFEIKLKLVSPEWAEHYWADVQFPSAPLGWERDISCRGPVQLSNMGGGASIASAAHPSGSTDLRSVCFVVTREELADAHSG